jgi:cellulose synthase (UDP-forming)
MATVPNPGGLDTSSSTSDNRRGLPMSFDPSHDLASGDERLALERRARTEKVYSPIVILLTALAAAGILLYSWFLLDPGNRGDLLPWSMVIVAETVLISQALISMWTILAGAASPRDYAFHAAREALLGPVPLGGDATDRPIRVNGEDVLVDVFITVYGEPVATIRRTATAAQRMTGRHRTWILDDGRSDEVKELAAELGVHYVRRLSNNGAKAGNVNHALSIAKGDYFAIFDADFVPKENFLLETVPFFVGSDVAFVQTPQTYGNLTSVISRGAGYMQTVFYRFIQPGRNHFNAAFCVGTNVVFRRSAVDDIGGMYTNSKSEDVWTSLMLHERGWRSVYIPDVLAVGDAPETIEGFTKQQQRWATGGFEILLTHNPLSRKRRLTADQRIMYFVTATHYLTGITPALLLLVPPLEIYFDLRPVSAGLGLSTWLLFYLGFYGMQVVLAFFTLGSFRWETLMLATASFPIYTRALFNVLVGREQKWHVTGRRGRPSSPFNFMVAQVLMFAFLLLTSFVAVWRDIGHSQLTLATVWNITNTLILGVFVVAGMREHQRLLHPRRVVAPSSRQATARTRATVSARPAAPAPQPVSSPQIPQPVSSGSIPQPVPSASLASNSGARS